MFQSADMRGVMSMMGWSFELTDIFEGVGLEELEELVEEDGGLAGGEVERYEPGRASMMRPPVSVLGTFEVCTTPTFDPTPQTTNQIPPPTIHSLLPSPIIINTNANTNANANTNTNINMSHQDTTAPPAAARKQAFKLEHMLAEAAEPQRTALLLNTRDWKKLGGRRAVVSQMAATKKWLAEQKEVAVKMEEEEEEVGMEDIPTKEVEIKEEEKEVKMEDIPARG
ncbi:hypothetical protein P280DRAFT_477739 [Massarina eburnea CBS 473.64]|uniref:Uncharacterized protein n=1 Tax=Massarina eburnea CBS 473.64 TaxID=1395130 RepID=A0A6A6S9U9_9PLEO|nr:hypothetical protein P280DRAFT_477739 [Massarina eburnea CBS 473.64]